MSTSVVDQGFAVDGAKARIEEFAAACRVQPDSITVFTLADVRSRSRKYALECDSASSAKLTKLSKLSLSLQVIRTRLSIIHRLFFLLFVVIVWSFYDGHALQLVMKSFFTLDE
jgi:hypothetical protein